MSYWSGCIGQSHPVYSIYHNANTFFPSFMYNYYFCKDDVPENTCSISNFEKDQQSRKQLRSPSKYSDKPNPKRFQPSKSNIKGKECKIRQDIIDSLIRESFVESPERTMSRNEVMDVLNTSNANLTTIAVKRVFLSVKLDKHKQEYRNVHKALSSDFCVDSPVERSTNSKISKLQQQLYVHQSKAKSIVGEIMCKLDEKPCDQVYLKALVRLHNGEMESVATLTNAIDSIYERELSLLTEREGCNKLSASDKISIANEFDHLSSLVNLNIRRGDDILKSDISSEVFTNLKLNFERDCPILTDIMHTLFPLKDTPDRKQKGVVHALSLLTSLKSKQCPNDIMLLFTILIASYGAGCRAINMLNKIGLTVHWTTLMRFLDTQLEHKKQYTDSFSPKIPLFFLIDNVNIYQGNKRHHRLFKLYGNNMWNFTARGLLIPNVNDIEELFTCEETATQAQRDTLDIKAEDITLESNQSHLKIWNTHRDKYSVELLKDGLGFESEKCLKDMSEYDVNIFLSTKEYQKQSNKVKICVPKDINMSSTMLLE